LDHAPDVDGGKFKIRRQLLTIARRPFRLISEFNESSLDDATAAACRTIVALDVVVPAVEAIQARERG